MARANTLSLGHETDRPVGSVSELLTDRSVFFRGLLQDVRVVFGGRKVAEQLAEIWDCDVRSAARYLSGERVPGGNELASLLYHPRTGPIAHRFIMQEAERRLSAADFANFENQMMRATLRVERRK